MTTNGSVVVVGHGRSPEGQGWGPLIDACDVVIRMWDWGWQDRNDYGGKYDIGLLEAHPSYMEQWRRHNHHEPTLYWIASIVTTAHLHMNSLPEPVVVFDQTPWSEKGQAMGGIGQTGRLRYTRGTLAALWAIENLTPNELILVGYDSVYKRYAQPTNEAFSEDYQANPGTFSFAHYDRAVKEDGTTTKHGNHDYAIERPVIDWLAEEHQVPVRFAQDIW